MKQNKDEWGEFLHLPGEKFYFNKIRAGIVRDTEAKTGKNAGISPIAINLRVSFARQTLRKVAKMKGYDRDWSGVKVEEELTKKAEGLFVWIATMMRTLSTTSHPDKELRALLFGE